jgi:hypothetical protein
MAGMAAWLSCWIQRKMRRKMSGSLGVKMGRAAMGVVGVMAGVCRTCVIVAAVRVVGVAVQVKKRRRRRRSIKLGQIVMGTHVALQAVTIQMVRQAGTASSSSSTQAGQLGASQQQQQALGWMQQQPWLQGSWLLMAMAAMALSYLTVTQRVAGLVWLLLLLLQLVEVG